MDDRPAATRTVRLHPHRGIGVGLYGTVGVGVLVVGLVSTVWNALRGRPIDAAATFAVSGVIVAILAVVVSALLWPDLTLDEHGVRGRWGWRQRTAVPWAQVRVDVDPEDPHGTLRLLVGANSATVSGRSWVGFADLIRLFVTTPVAAQRLSPAAVEEVLRLVQVKP